MNRLATLIAGLLLIGPAAVQAQVSPGPASSPASDWHGVLSTPDGDLRVVTHLVADAKGSVLQSPDQAGSDAIPLTISARDATRLVFSAPSIGGDFSGTWDAARKAWVGRWSQSGLSLPLVLTPGAAEPSQAK